MLNPNCAARSICYLDRSGITSTLEAPGRSTHCRCAPRSAVAAMFSDVRLGAAESFTFKPAHFPQPGLAGRCQNATMQQLCKRIREEPMRIVRLVFFVLAAAAMTLLAGAAQAAMKTQWIDYKQSNTALSGYLVYDDAVQGRRPGVLMIHDRSGFSAGTLADAEMIAKLGYVVFAEDIFGKGVVPKSVPEMTELITIYDKDRPLMRARALAGFDVLKAQPMVDPAKLASVGYCFGGTTGIELMETGAPLLGFVSVHGAYNNFAGGKSRICCRPELGEGSAFLQIQKKADSPRKNCPRSDRFVVFPRSVE